MDSRVLEFAPRSRWSGTREGDHFVQFYETDSFLLDSLREYVSAGLRASDAVIVVATNTHREALLASLHAEGLDIADEIARGRYIPLDAADLLATFMVRGSLDPESFSQVVGAIIARATGVGRRVRIFGEMVELLWTAGNYVAAIHLEGFWNQLSLKHSFSLFCGYRMNQSGADAQLLGDICAAHSSVFPAESYSALESADERLRAIVTLQQKANALELEIAERKVAEQRFRFLAESMPEKVFTARPTGEVDYCNEQWTEYTGIDPLELKDWGWTRVIHPDDREESVTHWRHSIASGEPFQVEHRFRRADGTYRWHLTRAHAMPQADGTTLMWVASHTEIDDQKRREAVLGRSIRQRDEFLSAISHDLKTPLTVLRGQAQVLQRRILHGRLDTTPLLRGLQQIESRSRTMAKLVDELLDVTRLRAGEDLHLERQPLDLVALVREVVAEATATTDFHHFVVRSGEQELIGSWDRVRLQHVLENLVSNAIKYSPHGGEIFISLAPITSGKSRCARLIVQDHGIGIAADDLPRIFEWFYRGKNARGGTFGSGLGLAGARQIVEQHGGTIEVTSHEGTGSTFAVRLPRDIAPKSAAPAR